MPKGVYDKPGRGGSLPKNGIGALNQARKAVLETGASGEIAETVLELARAMDRSLYVQKREQKLAYYRTSGRAKHNANVKAHYAQRRERILEYMRAYRAAHRDEIHAYNRAYHAAHRLKTQLI